MSKANKLFSRRKIGIRFRNIIGAGILLSFLAYLLLTFTDLTEDYQATTLATTVINVIFFGWLIFDLVSFRMNTHGKGRYYKYNMPIVCGYCAVAVIVSVLTTYITEPIIHADLEFIYPLIFLQFKSLYFLTNQNGNGINIILSTVSYSAGLIGFTAIIPCFFNKKRIVKKIK